MSASCGTERYLVKRCFGASLSLILLVVPALYGFYVLQSIARSFARLEAVKGDTQVVLFGLLRKALRPIRAPFTLARARAPDYELIQISPGAPGEGELFAFDDDVIFSRLFDRKPYNRNSQVIRRIVGGIPDRRSLTHRAQAALRPRAIAYQKRTGSSHADTRGIFNMHLRNCENLPAVLDDDLMIRCICILASQISDRDKA